MLEIGENGVTRRAALQAENWGELLDGLERGDGGGRRVVTAVRFSGVAVPTFREPAVLSTAIRGIGTIEVETTTVDALLHESARAACDSIAPLQNAVGRIAVLLRTGDVLAARRDLPELTASLQTLTSVTAMLVSAREDAGACRSAFDVLVQRVCTIVDAMIDRQVESDWYGVAKVLERDLSSALRHWACMLGEFEKDVTFSTGATAGPLSAGAVGHA